MTVDLPQPLGPKIAVKFLPLKSILKLLNSSVNQNPSESLFVGKVLVVERVS
jgi:hypothetical protein